jgi:hypothetical protein
MALNWFGGKAAPTPKAESGVAPTSSSSEERRAVRGSNREKLYAVVRDGMTRAGVLTASYKFKVLSLDARGESFLVMMDLVSSAKEDAGRLSEIEALITHNAKARHDLAVVGVYWRLSDHVTAGLSQRAGSAANMPAGVAKADAIEVDEMLAFKKAFAAMPAAPLSASGQVVHSGRRGPELAPESSFGLGDDSASPLGPTQYGELR